MREQILKVIAAAVIGGRINEATALALHVLETLEAAGYEVRQSADAAKTAGEKR